MVSLRHTYEQGSNRLEFSCSNPECMSRNGVWIGTHKGSIDIDKALKRWDGEIQITSIKARCRRCGSADFVSVMGVPPGRPGKRGRR